MRVRDERSGMEVPMILIQNIRKAPSGMVWIVGITKSILQDYKIGLLDCLQVHLSMWAYLVNKREFESFLSTNDLPVLSYRL